MKKGNSRKLELIEHGILGNDLKQIRTTFFKIRNTLSLTYDKTSKCSRLMSKLIDDLEMVRCEMDNHVCRENPDYPKVTHIYYGDKI